MQLVVSHLQRGLLHALLAEAVVETMAIVEHVIGWHDEYEQDEEQIDGDALVLLRLFHGATVVGQRGIGTELLEQLGVHLIIVGIERPLVERQGCHSTLVANVEDDLIVGVNAVVPPLYLSWCTLFADALQQQLSLRMLLTIVSIEG